MNYNVLALILGGGKGTRLQPLTKERSKPAVPIACKYRLVDIPISNCLNSRINKIYVLTQFNSASLNRHVTTTYHFDAFSKGFVDILAAEQTYENTGWFQGTADAVRQSLPYIKSSDTDYVLILSGDQLYQMDYEKLIEGHKATGAEVSIATLPVNAADATGFGIMKTNQNNEIISFIEKPDENELKDWKSPVDKESKKEGKDYLASMGIYLFNKDKLIEVLEKDPNETDFGKDIIPAMVEGDTKVSAYQFTGYWSDIGTIKSFYEANLDLAENYPSFNLYNNDAPIYSRARMLPATKIMGTTMDKVMLGDGCIISANEITHSLIGIRTRIDEGTVIKNSYVMGSKKFETYEELEENKKKEIPNVGIGKNCYLDRVISDINVRIGDGATIIGGENLPDEDTPIYKISDGIIILKRGQIIPKGAEIGNKKPKNELAN